MSRNLNSQLKYVINSSYYGDNNINRNGGHGSSKHSDKANGTKNGKIYSFNQKKNMISVAREFSNWMKEYHPEIRNVSELNERYAQEFVAYKSNEVGTSNEQIFTTKAHSIDQNIHRHIEKCDLSQNYNYNSCHSIRKYYAQETFNDYRKNGYSIEESAGKTIQNLGHSSSRLELTKTYIQNIH